MSNNTDDDDGDGKNDDGDGKDDDDNTGDWLGEYDMGEGSVDP